MPRKSRSTSRQPAESAGPAVDAAAGGRLEPVHFAVALADLNAHLYRVDVRLVRPAPRQRMSLPVWIPGSYLVREFARNLQRLVALQRGRAILLRQLDKNSWEAQCDPRWPLQLRYEIVASDASVRAAWLDRHRAFFNGTSLFLRLHGREQCEHRLDLSERGAPSGWRVATSMRPQRRDARGFGRYRAADYDELVDHPVEIGSHWSGRFQVAGVEHRVVVSGAPGTLDGERLLADSRRICEAVVALWNGRGPGRPGTAATPFPDYLFLLHAVDDGYGGLEHRNSTALVCARKDLPRLAHGEESAPGRPADGYAGLLGLISHEYFHAWNVKRLRPRALRAYDYDRENYTDLLWFFEGFTSYYDDLLVRRAGLIDDQHYLRQLGRTINQVLQTPGRKIQSLAQASFDAWVRYYRPDENTPNGTVSYYTKGAAVALCLDLSLRAQGVHTLDDVMRALWKRCRAGPMDESDLLAVLADLGAGDSAQQLRQWVHLTGELPLQAALEQHGVAVHEDPAQWAQALGVRLADGPGIRLRTVLSGSVAEAAGLMAQDEWIGIECAGDARGDDGWRLMQLDELGLYARPGDGLLAVVARDRRLLRLPLTVPHGVTTWRLSVRDPVKVRSWLGG